MRRGALTSRADIVGFQDADLSTPLSALCPVLQSLCDEAVARGHAFVQNLCRGHYELGLEHRPNERIRTSFDELAATP